MFSYRCPFLFRRGHRERVLFTHFPNGVIHSKPKPQKQNILRPKEKTTTKQTAKAKKRAKPTKQRFSGTRGKPKPRKYSNCKYIFQKTGNEFWKKVRPNVPYIRIEFKKPALDLSRYMFVLYCKQIAMNFSWQCIQSSFKAMSWINRTVAYWFFFAVNVSWRKLQHVLRWVSNILKMLWCL